MSEQDDTLTEGDEFEIDGVAVVVDSIEDGTVTLTQDERPSLREIKHDLEQRFNELSGRE